MKTYINKISLIFMLFTLISLSSCFDLDREPIAETELTTEKAFADTASYKQFLAKVYAGLALSGQEGPAGAGDIGGVDEGFSQFLRGYWEAQELPTDEAVIGWNDQTIKNFHYQTWTSSDVFIQALYYRLLFQVALSNEYLRQTEDDKLNSRGVSEGLKNDIQRYRAEVRFLRALAYWQGVDLFANLPFVTEADPIDPKFQPTQKPRAEIFEYVESELKAIEGDLADPRQNEYARVDKAGLWALMVRLYLNAEVYIKAPKYTECITYCNKILQSGYSLEEDYSWLFLADNHLCTNEIIFPIAFDGIKTRSYGGTTFIIAASLNSKWGDLPKQFGTNQAWGGTRTTKALVEKFTSDSDKRGQLFFTTGQSLEINDISAGDEGYGVVKFKNLTRSGNPGADMQYMDTDFPMFRLAEIYLSYAEAFVRGGAGADLSTALGYVNKIRERAYGNSTGNISGGQLTLDFLIDERARELYWETQRRTDLIRFGKYSNTNYLWPWKGGVKDGKATDSKFNIYPIPSSDLGANPNLTQNPGY